MKLVRTTIALCAVAAIALPGAALAKNGGDSDGRTGSTPAPTTSLIAGPCLTLGSTNSGLTVKKGTDRLDFSATSCSSTTQTYRLDVLDEATRVLYPGWDCGVRTYAAPSLTIAAGRSASVSLATLAGTCGPASAESHFVTLVASAADGTTTATAFAGWQHQVRSESR